MGGNKFNLYSSEKNSERHSNLETPDSYMSKINKKYKVPTAFQSEMVVEQDFNKTDNKSKKHNLIS